MSVKLKPLAEQVIVVTGASSGIGLTIARRAAGEGAKVVLAARDEASLRQAVDEIVADGGQAAYAVADVGNKDDVAGIVRVAQERFGGFDTWVNDAGVGVYAKLEEISEEDHRRIFETNYWGLVYGSLAAVRVLKERGGALINMGSIASEMPTPLLSAYAASKHAVKGFTDSLRLELIEEKAPVSVTLIKPSGIDTPFAQHAPNYMDKAAQVPPPAYDPDLVADAVLHAAETPTREITVGGAGKLMTLLAHVAPHLADRLYAATFPPLAKDASSPKRPTRGLHEPGSGGRARGGQSFVRGSSLYTAAQTHPKLAMGIGVAAGLAAAAVAAGALRRSGRGFRL
jgi:short-subunit dehydrogenase